MSVERGNFEETRYQFYTFWTDWNNSNTDKRGQILFDRPTCYADSISRIYAALIGLVKDPQLVEYLVSDEDTYYEQYRNKSERNIFVKMLKRGFGFREQKEQSRKDLDYQLYEKMFKPNLGRENNGGVSYDLRLTTNSQEVLSVRYPEALTTALLVSRALAIDGVDLEMDVIEESKNCVLNFVVYGENEPVYIEVEFTNDRPELNSLPFKLSLTTQTKSRESSALMN